ncbi:MAG: hypothetical protein JNM18_27065 [Planctomycetaceae bacterium]|nr:hypothetical protein [Planctomycetaceae bacterium]
MLPLGMVNLIALAVVTEFGWNVETQYLAYPLATIVAMWIVAVVSSAVAGWLTPLATDNRPRSDLVDQYQREFVPGVTKLKTES